MIRLSIRRLLRRCLPLCLRPLLVRFLPRRLSNLQPGHPWMLLGPFLRLLLFLPLVASRRMTMMSTTRISIHLLPPLVRCHRLPRTILLRRSTSRRLLRQLLLPQPSPRFLSTNLRKARRKKMNCIPRLRLANHTTGRLRRRLSRRLSRRHRTILLRSGLCRRRRDMCLLLLRKNATHLLRRHRRIVLHRHRPLVSPPRAACLLCRESQLMSTVWRSHFVHQWTRAVPHTARSSSPATST